MVLTFQAVKLVELPNPDPQTKPLTTTPPTTAFNTAPDPPTRRLLLYVFSGTKTAVSVHRKNRFGFPNREQVLVPPPAKTNAFLCPHQKRTKTMGVTIRKQKSIGRKMVFIVALQPRESHSRRVAEQSVPPATRHLFLWIWQRSAPPIFLFLFSQLVQRFLFCLACLLNR